MSQILADFLWLSDTTFLYYALILWFTLSVIDVFYNTDYINWLILLTLAVWATFKCNPSWEWGVLLFLVFITAFILAHIVARNYLHKLILPLLNKNAPKELQETLIGKTATILGEAENTCAQVEGVLYPVAEECRNKFKENDTVRITALRSGLVVVTKV